VIFAVAPNNYVGTTTMRLCVDEALYAACVTAGLGCMNKISGDQSLIEARSTNFG
jgi:hypothetical protein